MLCPRRFVSRRGDGLGLDNCRQAQAWEENGGGKFSYAEPGGDGYGKASSKKNRSAGACPQCGASFEL